MEADDVGKGRSKISISEIIWATTRIILLVVLQFGLDMTYKVGWFEFFGPQEIQRLVFDVLKKLLLTLYLWLFLSIFKKFVLPVSTRLSRPYQTCS